MKKNFAPAVALAVGVLCAALLLWLWARDRDGAQHLRAARGTAPAAVAPPPPPASTALDPVTRSLLTALQSLLTRSDTRAKEAMLTFKDEGSYRRFLARAQKSGLTLLGQLDALRTARVRYDAFSGLQKICSITPPTTPPSPRII